MSKNTHEKITLVGMSGVGKSSIGRQLSKHFHIPLIDTDALIHININTTLYEYILKYGHKAFLELEENIVCETPLPEKCIVATGGSVIYSDKAISYLKEHTTIVYLKDSAENIMNRIPEMEKRGIVSPNQSSFVDLYNERIPLYEKHADITVQIPSPLNIKNATEAVIKACQ
jgi:shikimate kinase